MSRTDDSENPYAAPSALIGGEECAEAVLLVRTHRSRVFSIKAVGVFHIFMALVMLNNAAGLGYQSFFYWSESIRDMEIRFKYPEPVAHSDRVRALQYLSLAVFCASLCLVNIWLGIGLCRLRGWTRGAATAQGFVLLIAGFMLAMYFVISHNDFARIGLVLPGLLLVLLAGFVRMSRNSFVFSPEYRQARAQAGRLGA